MREFKNVLVELRQKRHLTQDKLAEILGITKQALSHYERGVRYPKPETLEAIADYFNVDMDYLTGRSLVTTSLRPAAGPDLDFDEAKLLSDFRVLGDEGQAMLLSRAQELIKLGYTREEEAKKGVRKLS